MGNANGHSGNSKAHRLIDIGQSDDPHPIYSSRNDSDGGRLGPSVYGERMLQSPPDSPSSVSRSPLMFTPQRCPDHLPPHAYLSRGSQAVKFYSPSSWQFKRQGTSVKLWDSSTSKSGTLSKAFWKPSKANGHRKDVLCFEDMPMVPIARGDELTLGSYHTSVYNHHGHGTIQQERGVPTMIVWSYGGNNVAVEGSWDNWSKRQPLQKVGKDFTLVKILPSGVYQYKIILDKDWHYPDEVHSKVMNVLDVQDYVPENLDSVAGFEPPRSPISSYKDTFPNVEDFAKEPPTLPSHLHLTLLNVPPFEESTGVLPRPQHVTLNHLYVEKGKNIRSVLALGLTHRYRSKYVTVALYKPIPK